MLTLSFNILKSTFNVLTVVFNIKTTTYPSLKVDFNTFQANCFNLMHYQNEKITNSNKDLLNFNNDSPD